MSYTELDAWIDEKSLGDWPFDRWSVGSLPLRPGYDYFHFPHGISGIGALHHRLSNVFGYKNHDHTRLRALLDVVIEIVDSAIENSDYDAFSMWSRHELWLPILDDSLHGVEQPADMLAQSIDYVGVPDGHTEQELSAALGLWLMGELHKLPPQENYEHAVVLVQIGVAVGEAEYYRGLSEGREQEANKVATRTRKANDQRHAANRERTKEAQTWWRAEANGKMSNAEAARQIAAKYHVVEEVAKRWIRQFQRVT